MQLLLKVLSISCVFLGISINAQEQAPIHEFEFRVSLGHGKIENPLTKRDDININLLPEFSYYGERFYIENFVMGYSLFENEYFLIDAFGYLNRDGYFFELDGIESITVSSVLGRTPARIPINSEGETGFDDIDRKLSYLAGFNTRFDWQNFYLQFSAAQDISGVHEGNEAKLTLGYQFIWKNLYTNISVYGVNKSKELLNYYYGLHPLEWNTKEIPITDESDLNKGLRIALSYKLNDTWSISAVGEKQWLSDTIYASNLVDRKQILSWYAGITYSF